MSRPYSVSQCYSSVAITVRGESAQLLCSCVRCKIHSLKCSRHLYRIADRYIKLRKRRPTPTCHTHPLGNVSNPWQQCWTSREYMVVCTVKHISATYDSTSEARELPIHASDGRQVRENDGVCCDRPLDRPGPGLLMLCRTITFPCRVLVNCLISLVTFANNHVDYAKLFSCFRGAQFTNFSREAHVTCSPALSRRKTVHDCALTETETARHTLCDVTHAAVNF